MYNKQEFKRKLVEKFEKEFKSAIIIEQDMLIVKEENLEVSISCENIYSEYLSHGKLEKIIKEYICLIKNTLKENTTDINLDLGRIYPIVKNKNFGIEEKNIDFLREKFALDLDILYVVDMVDSFKFILNSEKIDINLIRERAFANLDKLTNVLTKLDSGLDIFSVQFNTDYAATLLLAKNIKSQILKKVGTNFLFAIPTSSSLLVAKNRPDYVKILKSLIEIDPDPNMISQRIYMYKNGKYQFADI